MYKDSVLSNYSHEQLTPLNSFLNNSQMLHSEISEITKDMQKKVNDFLGSIENIYEESDLMQNLQNGQQN